MQGSWSIMGPVRRSCPSLKPRACTALSARQTQTSCRKSLHAKTSRYPLHMHFSYVKSHIQCPQHYEVICESFTGQVACCPDLSKSRSDEQGNKVAVVGSVILCHLTVQHASHTLKDWHENTCHYHYSQQHMLWQNFATQHLGLLHLWSDKPLDWSGLQDMTGQTYAHAHLHTGQGFGNSCTISCLCMVLQQYFRGKAKHQYIPVATFADNFQKTDIAKQQMQYLEQPYKAPNKKCEEALITHHYALSCTLSMPLCTMLNELPASGL